MKNSTLLRYQIHDFKKSIIIFYGVIFAIFILSFFSGQILLNINTNNSASTINGTEISTAIFLFVCGICSFGESFHMFLQNGVTRKASLKGMILFQVVVSALLSVVDSLLYLLCKGIFTKSITSSSLFDVIYFGQKAEVSSIAFFFEQLLFFFLFDLFLFSLGHLIATIYYRMSKPMKIAISVGVPVFFTIVLPILDLVLFKQKVSSFFDNMLTVCFGLKIQQPLLGALSLTVLSVLTMIFRYLLIRRACKR